MEACKYFLKENKCCLLVATTWFAHKLASQDWFPGPAWWTFSLQWRWWWSPLWSRLRHSPGNKYRWLFFHNIFMSSWNNSKSVCWPWWWRWQDLQSPRWCHSERWASSSHQQHIFLKRMLELWWLSEPEDLVKIHKNMKRIKLEVCDKHIINKSFRFKTSFFAKAWNFAHSNKRTLKCLSWGFTNKLFYKTHRFDVILPSYPSQ